MKEAQSPEMKPPASDRGDRSSVSWRYGAIGSVVLSPDFLGVPAGLIVAGPVLCNAGVRNALGGILLAVAAIAAGVAALVLTSLTVVLGLVTPAYRRLLAKTPGGPTGVAGPFQWVIGTSAASVAIALAGAFIAPTYPDPWIAYVFAGAANATLLWAVLGCVQTSRQLVWHWARAQHAEDLAERAKASRPASSEEGEAE